MNTISKKIIKMPKKTNKLFAKKYNEAGFIPFTLNIQTNDNGKKLLKNVPSFSNIDCNNYDEYIDNKMNGMALRLGINNIVLIDVDNKDDTDTVLNGMIKWHIMTKKRKFNTPTQKTGNGGLHYLFKVSDDIFDKLPASITELNIDGQRYSIDFKSKNQFVIVEPTEYDGKNYQWTIDFKTEIQEMPKWLL